MTAPYLLWGIDNPFPGDASLVKCLPVLKGAGGYAHPTRYAWTYEQLAAYADEEEAREYAQTLDLEHDVDVPENVVALVVGKTFAENLRQLGISLPEAAVRIRNGACICLVPDGEAEQSRGRFSTTAQERLTQELGALLRDRRDGRRFDVSRIAAAHSVFVNVAFADRFERAVLDLIVEDLQPDGGTRYTRSLALHSARLRRPTLELEGAVRGRINHLVENSRRIRAPFLSDRERPILPSSPPPN
jgi:hypothetical protein